MYLLYFKIKGWLYKALGGLNIINACSRSLKDISNWKAAQYHNVVAIKKDPKECERGRHILLSTDKNKFDLAELIEGELSTPMSHILSDGTAYLIFCNFATHYVWDKFEKTQKNFSNFVPCFKNGGIFVVTFMQGELLENYNTECIRIYDEDRTLAFKVKLCSTENTTEDFVASIGKFHVETILYLKEMKAIFRIERLEFVHVFQFEVLRKKCTTYTYHPRRKKYQGCIQLQ